MDSNWQAKTSATERKCRVKLYFWCFQKSSVLLGSWCVESKILSIQKPWSQRPWIMGTWEQVKSSHSLLVIFMSSDSYKFVAGKSGPREPGRVHKRWKNPQQPSSSSAAPPKSLQDARSQQKAKARSNKHLSYVRIYIFSIKSLHSGVREL